MDQLAGKFDPENLSKAGAVFDLQKLDWLNGRWLREGISEAEFVARVLDWARENDRFGQGMKLAQSRITKLSDLPDLTGFLLKGDLGLTAADFSNIKKVSLEDVLQILQAVQPDLETIFEWTAESIEAELRAIAERTEIKLRNLLAPLFIAVSGSSRSLPLFDSMAILGRSVVRQRLKQAEVAVKAGVDAAKANNG